MTTTLSHDPFARTSVVRKMHKLSGPCDWCGTTKYQRLYEYGTRRDDSLIDYVNWHKGLFCCKRCHDSYHS